MAGIAEHLREYADAISERAGYGVTMPNPLSAHSGAPAGPTKDTEALYAIADRIEREHERRMEQCKRDVRRDFARFMRSVIADYEKGVSRMNRNHAHRKVRLTDDATGYTTCAKCGCRIYPYDNFCRNCGAKLTATEYEGKRSSTPRLKPGA